jgi:hypothetical protein
MERSHVCSTIEHKVEEEAINLKDNEIDMTRASLSDTIASLVESVCSSLDIGLYIYEKSLSNLL